MQQPKRCAVLFILLLIKVFFAPCHGACFTPFRHPKFVGLPKVHQFNMSSVVISWDNIIENQDCVDAFSVNYSTVYTPNDYMMTRQHPKEFFSVLITGVPVNVPHNFFVIAMEDKGFGMAKYRSPSVSYTITSKSENPSPTTPPSRSPMTTTSTPPMTPPTKPRMTLPSFPPITSLKASVNENRPYFIEDNSKILFPTSKADDLEDEKTDFAARTIENDEIIETGPVSPSAEEVRTDPLLGVGIGIGLLILSLCVAGVLYKLVKPNCGTQKREHSREVVCKGDMIYENVDSDFE